MKTYKILLSTLIAAAAASAVPAFATDRIESYDVTLDGNGYFMGGMTEYEGGAIYAYGSVTISGEEYEFRGNRVTDGGGAIFANGSVTISSGTNDFYYNETENGQGGAIYANDSAVTISGGTNTFSENRARSGQGGAIYASSGVEISGGTNTFTGNTAQYGSAIYAMSGAVTISGGMNTFTGNTATADGSAIWANSVTFSGDSTEATFSGNGLDIYSHGSVTIKDAGTYSFDGGIYAATSSLSIENSATVTFTGNAVNTISSATTISGTGTKVTFGESTTTTTSGLSVTHGAYVEINGSVTVNGDFTVDADSTLKILGTGTVTSSSETVSNVTVESGASVSVGNGAVKLTAAAAAITVNSVTKVATENLSLGDNVETLAAWDFDIENAESMVTVSIAIDSGITPEDVTVYHQNASGDWENVTSTVNLTVTDGIATFSTTNFSAYALGVASAIPEPSAFGLLAGIGALALAISRRRRSRKN